MNKKSFFAHNLLPAVMFIACGTIAYFVCKSYLEGTKHIDGTTIKEWEYWAVSIGCGISGFCVGKLFAGSNDDNDGWGGGDYFDCTGGAGGSM